MAVVGPILGAFGKTRVKQRNYSDAVQDAITAAARSATGDRAANAADLGAYTQGINRAIGRIEALNPEDTATLGGLISRTASDDPMAVYRGVGDYQVGLFDRFSRGLAEQGRAGQNLQFARMGLGGRGGSTYTNNALLDRISRNLAPAFAQVTGNIGRDTQILGNQRLAQGGQVANLINTRRGLQTQGAELALNPAMARASLADMEAGRLGTLGQAARTTTAGFQAEKDLVGRLADGLSEAEDTVLNTAMGLLSMYSGGGMGGMPKSGARSPGGAGQAQTFQPQFAPQVQTPQQSPGPWAGGFVYGSAPQGAAPAGASFYSPQVQDILYGYRPTLN